ncbi:two-component regulator propeller domain-containing protein [uncultured Mucilaginibacter sp.]|uniref:hybrid sensor histidine kinase/response regulator n=1 Tax=uncultured Mucilaginibacter sp. TaxID=797541 RepID=UPI0025E3820D|nr:two-component regulator propeller domain-containing protein [uncultured Mucilaginibacter sp.]
MGLIGKIYLFLCLFIYCGFTAYGQHEVINLSPFNSFQGLSQNTINAVIRDHYGFIWIGTQDGLNCYDGYKNIVYKHRSNDANSLPANYISSVCEDAHGDIWVGTRTGGLSRYDRRTESFINYSNLRNKVSAAFSEKNINTVYAGKGKMVWIGTDRALIQYDLQTKVFKDYQSLSSNISPGVAPIYTIYEAGNNLWVGTANGLRLFDILQKKWLNSNINDSKANKSAVYAINEDRNNNLWLGTSTGLNSLAINDGKITTYTVEPDKNSENKTNPVYSIAQSGSILWLGTNTTLQTFDIKKREFIKLPIKTSDGSNMPNDAVYSLLSDATGTLWIGTSSQGILKYNKNITIVEWFKAANYSLPSAQNIIRSMAEDGNGNLYLATDDGLDYVDQSGKLIKHYHHLSNSNSLSSNYTTDVLVSKDGNTVWIGTSNNGLDKLDIKTGKFKNYSSGVGAGFMNSKSVAMLMEDRKGKLWIATGWGGINILDPATNKFEKLTNSPANENSIADDAVQTIYEDHTGNVWIGGYTNGISIYNPQTKTFTHLNTGNSKLTCNVISDFYEDRLGNMWIGTMEGGLNCYHAKSKTITSITEQQGLIDNTIHSVLGDNYGKIWLSTNQGIMRYNPVSKRLKKLDRFNGLKSIEFNIGSGLTSKNGNIIIGSINGYTIINPKNVTVNTTPADVAITGLWILNKKVNAGQPKSVLQKSILNTSCIELNAGQSVITLEFAALNHTISERNKYAYRLNGFDQNWIYSDQRRVTYTNLDAGTYVFEVKAANYDGYWNGKVRSLTITVRPPFWKTWWFRLSVVLFLLAVLYLSYRFRTLYLRQQRLELRKQVRERTAEVVSQRDSLAKLNDDLQRQVEISQAQSEELQAQAEELQVQSEELMSATQNLEAMNTQLAEQKEVEQRAREDADRANKAKSTFLATMSHEIRTPLNGVLGMASLLSATELNKEQHEYTDAIMQSGQSLLNVINDVLDFSKIESGNLELDPQDFELRGLIEEVMMMFAAKTADTGVDLFCHIKGDVPPLLCTDSVRLRQVLINLVGNACKFTHKGEIVIKVSKLSNNEDTLTLLFEVTDTGIGIPADRISNLFEAFNQLDSSVTRKYGGSGLGLAICQRLVRLMGGEIRVSSKQSSGSVFSFTIECKTASSVNSASTAVGTYWPGKTAIVNNNETCVAILKEHLEDRKIEVCTYKTGREAIAAAKKNDFKLIIAGQNTDDMTGKAFCQQLKNIELQCPVILITGLGMDLSSSDFGGNFHTLTKPVRLNELHILINRLAKNYSAVPANDIKSVLSQDFADRYPYKMLVAEDNAMNQKLIVRILNRLGYAPDLANDGQEALEKVMVTSYDIILMDIQMPNLDGLEATRLIRSRLGNKPVIVALTANALTEDKQLCFEAGMNGYLTKPLNIDNLMNTLQNLHS